MELIGLRIKESIDVKQKILENSELLASIAKAAQIMIDCYKQSQGRIFFAGNPRKCG